MSPLTIGQVAERTGFTTTALRYYDRLGLVTPTARTDSGYRLYGDDAVRRLAFIARAKQLGCSLDEVADLVAIWDGERCAPVQRRFHELVTDKIHVTQGQIAQLLAFASQLQTAAARLGTPSTEGSCGDECACFAETAEADHSETSPVVLSASPTGEPAIACTLHPGAMPERVTEWQSVLAAARRRGTTADGRVRIELARHVDLTDLVRLMSAEQQCCTFFSFALTIDRRGIALEVGAPETAREIVDAVFGPLAASASQRVVARA